MAQTQTSAHGLVLSGLFYHSLPTVVRYRLVYQFLQHMLTGLMGCMKKSIYGFIKEIGLLT